MWKKTCGDVWSMRSSNMDRCADAKWTGPLACEEEVVEVHGLALNVSQRVGLRHERLATSRHITFFFDCFPTLTAWKLMPCPLPTPIFCSKQAKQAVPGHPRPPASLPSICQKAPMPTQMPRKEVQDTIQCRSTRHVDTGGSLIPLRFFR